VSQRSLLIVLWRRPLAFLDRNNQCYLPSVSVNRWLAVRLEFLGSLIMGAAALVSIFSLLYSGDIDPGLVGITLSYVITYVRALLFLQRRGCR
jgi:ATP-binding cassette subfamily C (CFTR/MRP) protein 1